MKQDYKLLIVATIGVGGAFLVPALLGEYWLGFILALIGSAIFLGMVYRFGSSRFKKQNSKKTTLTFFSLLIVSSSLIFAFDYYKANFQKELLREIRVTIDTGVIQSEIRTELLEVFREYQLSSKQENPSIVQLAMDFFGKRLVEANKLKPENEDLEKDFTFLFQENSDVDSFSIYSIAEHSKSWDKKFENRNGSVGKLQTKTTVSKGGVSHEREN